MYVAVTNVTAPPESVIPPRFVRRNTYEVQNAKCYTKELSSARFHPSFVRKPFHHESSYYFGVVRILQLADNDNDHFRYSTDIMYA